MIFLNPLFLIGLAAAAIPLIIHLFNFRRPRRVNFSSLAFLHEIQKSTMQRVRIKQWLLLALRTLAIAFLVMSFARPTLRGTFAGMLGGGGSSSMALVVDNSTSMSIRDAGGAYSDQAKTLLSGLLTDFSSGDEAIVVSSTDPANVQRYRNRASALEAIQAIEPAAGEGVLSQAIARAAESLGQSLNLNKEIYVASDFQASTLTDTTSFGMPEDVRLVLLPIGGEAPGNLAVTGVNVQSQIIAQGQPVQMEATFTNHGAEDIRGQVASVYLAEERVAQATIDVDAGASATAVFAVTPRQGGWLRGSVQVDDNQYLFDNSRAFTLHVPEERRLLVVSGATTAERFLRLALSEQLSGEGARFTTRFIQETGLSGETLGAYDAVLMAGVQTLSSGERASLDRYVQDGGGLLVFPGEAMSLEDYNDLLGLLGAGHITRISERVEGGATAGSFDAVDTDHALFEGMFEPDPSGDAPVLEQPVIFRVMEYVPGSGAEQSIITLTSGTPFLHEIRAGQGSVLLYGVEAGASWSDYPVRGLFIPMLYRSLYYLSATGSVTGEEMVAGRSLQIRLASVPGDDPVAIRDETGRETIPEQRSILGARLVEVGGPFYLPGAYDIISDGTLLRRFVVHPDPRESDLALLPGDEAAQILTDLTGSEVQVLDLSMTSGASVEEQIREARTGVELWNVFLGLALVCLIAEMLLAKWWRPETAG